ncbi:hypothetical protein BDN70DRAFT_876600 [Pholiota conissans]|uniref:Uncharacterized protein n=1 Tax=Pholiota conissans TaxID=109636 RepID=A0A9P5Z579_9AGAR|nr:hypothetical protein BDN70DRAFT_876600 [Pholiota conissans]
MGNVPNIIQITPRSTSQRLISYTRAPIITTICKNPLSNNEQCPPRLSTCAPHTHPHPPTKTPLFASSTKASTPIDHDQYLPIATLTVVNKVTWKINVHLRKVNFK